MLAHLVVRRAKVRVRRTDASEIELPVDETFVQLLSHDGHLLVVTWAGDPDDGPEYGEAGECVSP